MSQELIGWVLWGDVMKLLALSQSHGLTVTFGLSD